ncbi:hypothetical protein DSO57_1016505 [Entomophthora muscae]|uniref:Uncharacterized protein n=2 Tax=Entomophthora muscae TaxID=34485 RepID=A0ACC2U6Q4_9FUNG|nr:hypothetical protein DSO57_1003693 [Entomophthora muscae]KAJ9085168.1 hypothetical protein DSO57_1016505 [Entomophthora muscae]
MTAPTNEFPMDLQAYAGEFEFPVSPEGWQEGLMYPYLSPTEGETSSLGEHSPLSFMEDMYMQMPFHQDLLLNSDQPISPEFATVPLEYDMQEPAYNNSMLMMSGFQPYPCVPMYSGPMMLGPMFGMEDFVPHHNSFDPIKVKRHKNVGRACTHCKKAHLACDESRPCKRCTHLGKSNCIDVEHKRRGRPKSNANADKETL